MKSNFRDWTLDKIDETFETKQVRTLQSIEELIKFEYKIDEVEKKFLDRISDTYKYLGGESWNEAELESKVVTPLIVYAQIDNEEFTYFLERNLSATLEEYELVGRVDGMIATGFRNPKKPFFCLSEYKKAQDPEGDPQAQALIAMLVAQHHNNDNLPIYGSYIVGRQWVFMALEGKKYTFSDAYTVDNEDIYDVFRILKSLKSTLLKRVEASKSATN